MLKHEWHINVFEFPSVDCAVAFSELHSPSQWIAQPHPQPLPPHPLWRIAQSPLVDSADLTVKNSGRHIVVGFRIPSGLYIIVYYCFKTWDKGKKYLN